MDIAAKLHEGNDRLADVPRPRTGDGRRPPLTAERVEQLRDRIRERAYDTDAALGATARGILGSGEM